MIEHATISLHLFAHQDDELGILPVLRRELRANVRSVCSIPHQRRDAEPRHARGTRSASATPKASRCCGPPGRRDEDVRFVGLAAGIEDGSLYQHLDRAFETLCRTLADVAAAPLQRIYCPAWEGGHHDHDAVHLLALALAAPALGALDRVLQFPFTTGVIFPARCSCHMRRSPRTGAPCASRCRAAKRWRTGCRHAITARSGGPGPGCCCPP